MEQMILNEVHTFGDNAPHVVQGDVKLLSEQNVQISGSAYQARVVVMEVKGAATLVNKGGLGIAAPQKGASELHHNISVEVGDWAAVQQLEHSLQGMRPQYD